MVYLQDADNAVRLATLNGGGIHLLSVARSRLLRWTVARNVSGQLGLIDGEPAAVYVAGGRLWLAIEGRPWFLDELQAEIDRDGGKCLVRISTPEQTYDVSVNCGVLDADTTPFASAEDFSFGLWAAEIIRDPERQDALIETLIDAPLDEVPEHAKHDPAQTPVEVRDAWKSSVRSRSDATKRPMQ